MADYRTKPETELTYYAFSQPNGCFEISRYDTLDEAINKFKESDTELSTFSGIGISKEHREIDIIHKNEDIYILVTDYNKLHDLKTDPEIKTAVNIAVQNLGVIWEYNNNIFNRSVLSSLCIPCVSKDKHLLHNEMIDNLSLKPERPDIIFSAIDSFYLSDNEEASSLKDIVNLCREGKHPKVESINVSVEDNITKETGKITVSPQDYLVMADNYLLSHVKGFPLYETNLAFDKLAGDLNDFVYDFDFYEYMDNMTDLSENVIDMISKDLKEGNVKEYIDFLQGILIEDDASADILFEAKELIARLNKIEPAQEYNKEVNIDIQRTPSEKTIDSKSKGDKGEPYLR